MHCILGLLGQSFVYVQSVVEKNLFGDKFGGGFFAVFVIVSSN